MKLKLFLKEWHKIYKTLIKQSEFNQRAINNIQKTQANINHLKNIYDLINSHHITINEAIKILNINKNKSTLYALINKIKLLTNKNEIIDHILIKNTGPKIIKYKYDQTIRKKIADEYYINHNNKVNVWIMFRHFYSQLSLRIVCKIINEDIRNTNNINRSKMKHRTRFYNMPFGNLQMDLKIIGAKESPTKKRITIFDAKDEQSKLYYMEIVPDASTSSLLVATKNMINYFNNELGLKIKRIRTDNAMMFKQNNFVRSFPYNDLLASYNIVNQKIPIGQPECNGVIERQHLILDKEFLPLINSSDNLETLNIKAKDFVHKFNFERYHFYTFLMYDKNYNSLVQKYFIPINFYHSFN